MLRTGLLAFVLLTSILVTSALTTSVLQDSNRGCSDDICSKLMLPYCQYGQTPQRFASPANQTCCWDCREVCREACKWSVIPLCAQDQKPVRNTTTCCPDCQAPLPVCTNPDLPLCGDDQAPVMNRTTGCYSCKTASGRTDDCTSDMIKMCQEPTEVCAAGMQPTRLASCCLSCKPAASMCSSENSKACASAFESNTIRVCAAAEIPAFNGTTCCRSCRKNDDDKKKPTAQCTAADFKTCIQGQPVCANGETVLKPNNACCALCKRPERNCDPDDVAQCAAVVPTCTGTSKPLTVDGDCCRSCVMASPTCTPACSDTELCVRKDDDGTTTCRSVARILFHISSSQAGRREKLCNFTDQSIRDFIKEVVNRFCDNPQRTQRCARFKSALANIGIDGVVTSIRNRCKNEGLNVTVIVPAGEDVVASVGHIFATGSDSAVSVLADAAQDSDATSSAFTATATTGSTNSGVSVAPSFVVAALLAFTAFQYPNV